MQRITKEEYNEILKSGHDLLLYFYKEQHAESTLGLEGVREVDALIAKPFGVYVIDAENQPEIAKACGVKDVPEAVAIRNTRIHNRMSGVLNSHQLLQLMK